MRVYLPRQLSGFWDFGTFLLITTLLFLISSLGPISRILENGGSVSASKEGVIREPDSVLGYHPTLHEPKLSDLKDHGLG